MKLEGRTYSWCYCWFGALSHHFALASYSDCSVCDQQIATPSSLLFYMFRTLDADPRAQYQLQLQRVTRVSFIIHSLMEQDAHTFTYDPSFSLKNKYIKRFKLSKRFKRSKLRRALSQTAPAWDTGAWLSIEFDISRSLPLCSPRQWTKRHLLFFLHAHNRHINLKKNILRLKVTHLQKSINLVYINREQNIHTVKKKKKKEKERWRLVKKN